MEWPHAKWGTTSLYGSSDIFSKMLQFNEISLFLSQLLLSGPTAPWIPKEVFSSLSWWSTHSSLCLGTSFTPSVKHPPAGRKMGIWVGKLGKNNLNFTFLMISALCSLEDRYISKEWRVLPAAGKNTFHCFIDGTLHLLFFFFFFKASLEIVIPRKQEIKVQNSVQKANASPNDCFRNIFWRSISDTC